MLLSLLVVLPMMIGNAVSAIADEKPNIVFFLVDDWGYYDTAFTGSKLYLTPHTDQLAAEGVSFTQAYCAHPRCVPSRYALMSGRFPARGGVPGGSYALGLDRTSIAEGMRDAGYATWFIGKWHLTEKDDTGFPDEHGFDVNIAGGHAGAPISYIFPYNEKKKGKVSKEKPIEHLDDGEPGDMLTDRLTVEAEKLIRRHAQSKADKPFFLTLSHYGVHTPFEDSQDRIKMFRQRLKKEVGELDGPEYIDRDGTTKAHQDNEVYAAMIYRVDESLGRIVSLLEELGLDKNTVIVMTSDHGGLSNRGAKSNRGLATSNLPLRGGKGHLLEGGVRVPLIAKWPGHTVAGSESDMVSVGTDLFPTFLTMAGAELLPDDHTDGISITPAIAGKPQTREKPVFWYNPRPRPDSTGDEASSAIREGDYKLIHWYGNKKNELYNIRQDPTESKDLSSSDPERVKLLSGKLFAWLKTVDAVKPNEGRKKKSQPEDGDEQD